MDHARVVRELDSFGDPIDDPHCAVDRCSTQAFEAYLQVLAFEQLHREIRLSFELTVVEDLDDIGTAKLGCGARLALESLQ